MADEVDVQDVPAESSPAPDAQGQPTPPAAPQPGSPGQPPRDGQWVPYERLEKVSHQNQELRAAYAQLQGRMQQMEALQQKASQQGGQLSAQDQQTYQQAWTAIEQIFMASPKGQKLMRMADQAEKYDGLATNFQSMQNAQLRGLEQQGVARIVQFADQEGLPKDPGLRTIFVKTVESMALTIPQARERFAQGDLTLIDEAIALAKPLLDHLKREGQTQLLDTKQKTRNLPPAPRGSAAGPPGLPKMEPGKEREFANALHQRASDMLSG